MLKSEFTQSLAAAEYKYEAAESETLHLPRIFTIVARLFREAFEECWLMWRQRSFCYPSARGCLPLGTKCTSVCVSKAVH